MSDLNDPRVLFAAERTLLAWSRTAAGLIAFGFLIDRASLVAPAGDAHSDLALGIGLAFMLLGCALSVVSAVQYRRLLPGLRPAEIPPRYWTQLPAYLSFAMAALGLVLAGYVLIT